MAAAVELAFSVAAATVFGAAGSLKLLAREPGWHRLLACAELVVAATLVVPPLRAPGLAAASVLGAGFVAYGLRHGDRPCRCFGERFEATTRAAQLARSLALFAVALAGAAAWLASRGAGGGSGWAFSAVVVGLIIGAVVVVLPTVLSAGSERPYIRPL